MGMTPSAHQRHQLEQYDASAKRWVRLTNDQPSQVGGQSRRVGCQHWVNSIEGPRMTETYHGTGDQPKR